MRRRSSLDTHKPNLHTTRCVCVCVCESTIYNFTLQIIIFIRRVMIIIRLYVSTIYRSCASQTFIRCVCAMVLPHSFVGLLADRLWLGWFGCRYLLHTRGGSGRKDSFHALPYKKWLIYGLRTRRHYTPDSPHITSNDITLYSAAHYHCNHFRFHFTVMHERQN